MTVLIVEDELFLRWNLADHLRGAGYLVAEVDSAQRAIDLCQGGTRIDILITDVQLNGGGSGGTWRKHFGHYGTKSQLSTRPGTQGIQHGLSPKVCFSISHIR